MNGPALMPPPPRREGELLPPRRLSLLDRFGLWWAHPCHHWQTVKDTGMNLYECCTTCGERRAYRYGRHGYQPIDRQWVETGAWFSWDGLKPTAGSGGSLVKPTPKPLDTVDDTKRRPPAAPDDRPLWPDLDGEADRRRA